MLADQMRSRKIRKWSPTQGKSPVGWKTDPTLYWTDFMGSALASLN